MSQNIKYEPLVYTFIYSIIPSSPLLPILFANYLFVKVKPHPLGVLLS